MRATAAEMASGADVIYQAALLGEPWHGYADFLRRVPAPSNLGPWSYEVVDTMLARTPGPHHVMQLCVDSDLLARISLLASTLPAMRAQGGPCGGIMPGIAAFEVRQ